MNIIIDAGHGGRWPQGDPGVVSGDKIESWYAYMYANALFDYLSSRGFSAVRTRTQDVTKTPLRERTRMSKPGDLFISLHFDSVNGSRLIYYSKHPESKKLAEDMDQFFQSRKIIPSTSSRFGGLYIDDARCPAILIEIDRITDATDDAAYIRNFCETVEKGINRYIGKEMPFSRVFLVTPYGTEELEVEKMSIVGNKLYVKTDVRL